MEAYSLCTELTRTNSIYNQNETKPNLIDTRISLIISPFLSSMTTSPDTIDTSPTYRKITSTSLSEDYFGENTNSPTPSLGKSPCNQYVKWALECIRHEHVENEDGTFSPIEKIGTGTYSNVYSSKESPDIVIKVIKEEHLLSPKTFGEEDHEEKIINRIRHASDQYSKLELLFSDRLEGYKPFTQFLNSDPEDVLGCGYSVFERITPFDESTRLWTADFNCLPNEEKKLYNQLLELILVDDSIRELCNFYEDLSKHYEDLEFSNLADKIRLGLDLKWNNLGIRNLEGGEKQLVLSDLCHEPVDDFLGTRDSIAFCCNETVSDSVKQALYNYSIADEALTNELQEKKAVYTQIQAIASAFHKTEDWNTREEVINQMKKLIAQTPFLANLHGQL